MVFKENENPRQGEKSVVETFRVGCKQYFVETDLQSLRFEVVA
jgi:hypothetical protein